MSEEHGNHLTYKIEDGRFKLSVDDFLIYNVMMAVKPEHVFLPFTRVECLYRICLDNPEILMLLLQQLEKEGKL